MEKNKISRLASRLDRIKLYLLLPLIFVDIIISGNDWDEYYESDPLWECFQNEITK